MTNAAPIDPKYVSLLWAGPEQAAEIAKLHAELFDPAWPEDSVRTLLDHPASTAFMAMVGGAPKTCVGFVMAQLAADEAEILSIGVAKDWQRKGLGKRLVEGVARAAVIERGVQVLQLRAHEAPVVQHLLQAVGDAGGVVGGGQVARDDDQLAVARTVLERGEFHGVRGKAAEGNARQRAH